MILLIDNYDSFTYNLYQYFLINREEVSVFRNDAITPGQIEEMNPRAIVLSPGPGRPSGAGISLDVVRRFKGVYPILGICLGHQTIGEAFGGKVIKAARPMHGKLSSIKHTNRGVFKDLENPLQVTRYHSLVLDPARLPGELEVTALSEEGEVMGIRHREYNIEGVQFHPEAVLTRRGLELLKAFMKGAGRHGID